MNYSPYIGNYRPSKLIQSLCYVYKIHVHYHNGLYLRAVAIKNLHTCKNNSCHCFIYNVQVLKWNFTAPRAEFNEQLRDQMEKNFSPAIIEVLMHKDFQKHIKAIQMLAGVRSLGVYKITFLFIIHSYVIFSLVFLHVSFYSSNQ